MSIKLVPLKCPHCGSILKSDRKDLLYMCDNCGTFVYAPTETVVNVKIFDFEVLRNSKRYYMPVLTYVTDVEIYSEEVRGFFKERGMGGRWLTYIPAGGSLPAEVIVMLSKMLTSSPPQDSKEIDSFRDARPLPMEITIEEGAELAEFVFLSYEVDRPGILQGINYSFSANFNGIVYIPVYYDRGYILGLRGYGGK